MEWAARGDIRSSSSTRSGRGLFGFLCPLGFLCLFGSSDEILRHTCSCTGSRCVGTHVDADTRLVASGEDAVILVNLIDIDAAGYASVASDDLIGANDKSRTHDGAFSGLLRQLREGGEAW